jgi:hypothetical protein
LISLLDRFWPGGWEWRQRNLVVHIDNAVTHDARAALNIFEHCPLKKFPRHHTHPIFLQRTFLYLGKRKIPWSGKRFPMGLDFSRSWRTFRMVFRVIDYRLSFVVELNVSKVWLMWMGIICLGKYSGCHRSVSDRLLYRSSNDLLDTLSTALNARNSGLGIQQPTLNNQHWAAKSEQSAFNTRTRYSRFSVLHLSHLLSIQPFDSSTNNDIKHFNHRHLWVLNSYQYRLIHE